MIGIGCPLCKLERKTPWYYQTSEYVLLGCQKCGVPMMVWRDHSFPSPDKVEEMKQVAQEMFPNTKIDEVRRTIPNHYHFHMR